MPEQVTPQGAVGSTAGAAPTGFVSPPITMGKEFNVDHDDDAPFRFHALDNVLGPATTLGLAGRELEEVELQFLTDDEPATFAEVEQEKVWHDAMRKEMRSMEENQTWHLVNLPSGHRPIGLKWVYNLKKDASG